MRVTFQTKKEINMDELESMMIGFLVMAILYNLMLAANQKTVEQLTPLKAAADTVYVIADPQESKDLPEWYNIGEPDSLEVIKLEEE